ncbi:MAG: SH3-like domain-containing protein [Bacteroidales bacterium]|nr:SH3-like domain-containing protein [Bacteroidales bacterium]
MIVKDQFKRILSMMLVLVMAISLLSGLTITADAASESALREAIEKNAQTYSMTAAVRNDGTVTFDNTMESYIINGWPNVASIAEPVEYSEPVALRWDGTVLTKSNHPWRDVVSSWRNIVSVHELWFRGYEIVALRLDGTVVSTDPNSIYNTWTNVESLKQAKWEFSFVAGITRDGKVLCPYFDVSSWTDIVQVDCSSDLIVGLRKDGTVLYADDNGSKVMEGWTDVVQVACQEDILALRSDGTVLTTADPKYRADLSKWKDIVAIDNNFLQYAGVKSDGSIVMAGEFDLEYGAPDANEWKDIVDIKVYGSSLVGLRADGTVLEWYFGETKQLFSNVRLPVSTSAGKPSKADLIPFGNKIAYPKESSYLDAYETKCVKAPKGNSIYVFWNAGGALSNSKRPFYLYEGDVVTVLAREKTRSCVIFTDINGDKQVGWVSTNYLEDVKVESGYTVQSSNKPSKEDLVPFGNKIAYPKEASYLDSYETKYVKSPKGNSIYVFWNADGPLSTSKRPFYLYEGDEVTVLAREKTRSCVIFTDLDGDKQVGWVSTNYLSDTK